MSTVQTAAAGSPLVPHSRFMINPCDKVRKSCLQWVDQHTEHVTIDPSAISTLARQIITDSSGSKTIVWDEEGWHYHPSSETMSDEVQRERIALYILALDAINFCFWPLPAYEYEQLSCRLTEIASRDHAQQAATPTQMSESFALSARNLSRMTAEGMRKLFEEDDSTSSHKSIYNIAPPDIEIRCRLWNQVGEVLMEKFDGSAWILIQSAQGSAVRLVQVLIDHFEGFCDYNDNVYFLKRAQICVADWNAALHLQLTDIGQLTTFADYRVPQLLRHSGVMVYSQELSRAIDAQQELAVGSPEEYSIRAATVVAVERIVQELQALEPAKAWTAVETDWYLWQVGERMQLNGELLPHHRVRTIYY